MFAIPLEMQKDYLLRRLSDVLKLKSGLENHSIDEFHICGHQIIGNASSFGFKNFEPVAKKMQELSIEELDEMGPQLIEEFSTLIHVTRNDKQL